MGDNREPCKLAIKLQRLRRVWSGSAGARHSVEHARSSMVSHEVSWHTLKQFAIPLHPKAVQCPAVFQDREVPQSCITSLS